MIAFLLAGLVLGVLARTIRGGFGAPQVLATVGAALAGTVGGGVATNLATGEPAGDLTTPALVVGVLLALVLLGVIETRGSRRARA